MPRVNLMSIRPISLLAALSVGAVSFCDAEENAEPALAIQLRQPVAIVAQPEYLLVGNRGSGTISMLDTSTGSITAEHLVAKQIADMAELPDGGILVLDDAGQQLWKVSFSRSTSTWLMNVSERRSIHHHFADSANVKASSTMAGRQA